MMQVSKILTVAALVSLSGSGIFAPRAPTSRAPASAIEIPAEIPGKGKQVYDLGSLKNVGVETLATCTLPYKPDAVTLSGHAIKMLGAAFVYMGPSNGQSMLGHVAERFVYCRDQQLFDAVYEYAEPDPLMMSLNEDFEKEYGISLQDYSAEEKAKILKSLYVTITYNPANYYTLEQMRISRSIYEAWYDLDGETEYKLLVANATRYQEQSRKIKAHEPLPEYKIFSANCTTLVKDDLAIVNPAFLARHHKELLTPGALYRSVTKRNLRKIIVYPSQRLLRILRMKQAGQSRLFEGFVPLSKTLRHAFPGTWTLLYDDGSSPWRKMLLSPIYGAVNFAAGAAETVYGAATLPVSLFKKVTGIDKAKRQRELKALGHPDGVDAAGNKIPVPLEKIGLGRMRRGLADMLKSLSEVFTLKIKYPITTPWTPEERQFFQELQQNSALLEFMKAEWEKAPLVVTGDATDVVQDPAPEDAPVSANDELLVPEISQLE